MRSRVERGSILLDVSPLRFLYRVFVFLFSFFYKGSEEELTPDKLQPGQRLSIAMGEHIKTTLFAKENAQKIHWERYGDGIERRNPA